MTPSNYEQIQSDIAPFADPMSKVEVNAAGATWIQRRVVRQIKWIGGDPECPDLEFNGQKFGYKNFFASEHMADLRGLAHAIQEYTRQSNTFVGSKFVEGTASIEDGDGPHIASKTLREECEKNIEQTNVIFLRAPAGGGKSALLLKMTYDQAEKYALGQTQSLFFYIDAQGKALARTDEAIAVTIQDLRAQFTYHSVPVLARLGLLVPIIDGFDELLGVGGYQEAFSSLVNLISKLKGLGTLIASARSSFYQTSTFGQYANRNANTLELDYKITPVDLHTWEEAQLVEYLSKIDPIKSLHEIDPKKAVAKLKLSLGEGANELLSTPFFAIQLFEALEDSSALPTADAVRKFIVDRFLQREVQKLKDKEGNPILTFERHYELLEALAEEMWWQETRRLDETTVRTIAELNAEKFGLSSEKLNVVIERITSHALLSAHESPKLISFKHEIYYALFSGRWMARMLSETNSSDMLSRSTISLVIARETILAALEDGRSLETMLSSIDNKVYSAVTRAVCRSNAGTLIGSMIAKSGKSLPPLTFKDAHFDNFDFSRSELANCKFENCEFQNVNFAGAIWSSINFSRVTVTNLTVDEASKLEITGWPAPEEVGTVELRRAGQRSERAFELSHAIEILRKVKLLPAEAQEPIQRTPTQERRLAVLDKILSLAARSFHFSENDFNMIGIKKMPDFDFVFDLMKSHKIVMSTNIQRHGLNTVFRLTFMPELFLKMQSSGAPNQVTAFMTELLLE